MLQAPSAVQRLPEAEKEEEKGHRHGRPEILANFQIAA
jgi:hypothetical protein